MPGKKGLDIAGGMRVVLEVGQKHRTSNPRNTSRMQSERNIIDKRISGFQGVTEPLVFVQGQDRLVVELPGVMNPDEALDGIRSTASLKFFHLVSVRSRNNPLGEWEIHQERPTGRRSLYIHRAERRDPQ